ncbi:helix-turn-helix domain-containing protein [Nitratifractor salsuginis]|nr:helix-turn-helix domain-containing protein [Nitratifractor salsuginis]
MSRQFVEYLLIEDMARAGWTTRQIVAATGFGERRVQRIVKKIREEQE